MFDPRAIDLIYEYSDGVPRLINMLCDKALLAGFALGIKTITVRIIKASIRELEGTPELTAVSAN